jgi:hypothetical protein
VVWVAPVALAVVFAVAGGSKLADRDATATGFAELGLPRPAVLAGAVPAVELATAVLLIALPPVGAVVALGLLSGFSWLLADRLRRGVRKPCRCFGGARTRPIGWWDLARNAALAALAVVTLVAPPA